MTTQYSVPFFLAWLSGLEPSDFSSFADVLLPHLFGQGSMALSKHCAGLYLEIMNKVSQEQRDVFQERFRAALSTVLEPGGWFTSEAFEQELREARETSRGDNIWEAPSSQKCAAFLHFMHLLSTEMGGGRAAPDFQACIEKLEANPTDEPAFMAVCLNILQGMSSSQVEEPDTFDDKSNASLQGDPEAGFLFSTEFVQWLSYLMGVFAEERKLRPARDQGGHQASRGPVMANRKDVENRPIQVDHVSQPVNDWEASQGRKSLSQKSQQHGSRVILGSKNVPTHSDDPQYESDARSNASSTSNSLSYCSSTPNTELIAMGKQVQQLLSAFTPFNLPQTASRLIDIINSFPGVDGVDDSRTLKYVNHLILCAVTSQHQATRTPSAAETPPRLQWGTLCHLVSQGVSPLFQASVTSSDDRNCLLSGGQLYVNRLTRICEAWFKFSVFPELRTEFNQGPSISRPQMSEEIDQGQVQRIRLVSFLQDLNTHTLLTAKDMVLCCKNLLESNILLAHKLECVYLLLDERGHILEEKLPTEMDDVFRQLESVANDDNLIRKIRIHAQKLLERRSRGWDMNIFPASNKNETPGCV